MSLRPIFKADLRWQVGNGRLINFWQDNWVFPYPLIKIIQNPIVSNALKVIDFISHDKRWQLDLVSAILPIHIFELIIKVFIPSNDIDDEVFWGLLRTGSTQSNLVLSFFLILKSVGAGTGSIMFLLNLKIFYGKLAIMDSYQGTFRAS